MVVLPGRGRVLDPYERLLALGGKFQMIGMASAHFLRLVFESSVLVTANATSHAVVPKPGVYKSGRCSSETFHCMGLHQHGVAD